MNANQKQNWNSAESTSTVSNGVDGFDSCTARLPASWIFFATGNSRPPANPLNTGEFREAFSLSSYGNGNAGSCANAHFTRDSNVLRA